MTDVIRRLQQELARIDAIQDNDSRFAAFELFGKQLHRDRQAVYGQLERQLSDPRRLDTADIQRYHDLEVSDAFWQAAASQGDPLNSRRVRNALEWQTPSGQPSAAMSFRMARNRAINPDNRPAERAAVTIRHTAPER